MSWCVLFIILRSTPTPCGDPQLSTTTGESPSTIRFASGKVCLQLCEVSALTRRSHLRAIYPKVSLRSLLSIWLLICAGDIEINPGPRIWKNPCGVCAKPVKSNQQGVQCEVCYKWLHTKCIGLSNEEYSELQLSDEPWC